MGILDNYVQRSRPANAVAQRSVTARETVRPSDDSCAVARQYSSAVSRPAQSPSDVTQLNTSLTAIIFTFEAAGIPSVEGL